MTEEGKTENEMRLERMKYKNDALKTATFATHMNKMTPPSSSDDAHPSAVVQAIHGKQYTKEVKFLELLGYEEDPLSNTWVPIREPVMNLRGVGKMMQILRTMTETVEFSNLHEDFVHPFAATIIKLHTIDFDISPDTFELGEDDADTIFGDILVFAVSSVNKAKNAGHRNVIRNAMSEDTIKRVMAEPEKKSVFGGGFNPLGGKK